MSKVFYEKDCDLEIIEANKISRRIKGYDGKLMMVEVYFENYSISEPHTHSHEQLTYCLEGEFDFHIEGEIKTLTVGDTIYISPNVIHNCSLKAEKGRLLDVFTPIRKDFIN